MRYRLLRIVVALVLVAGASAAPRTSVFEWLVWTTVLGGLAVLLAPKDLRLFVPATFLALTMLRPALPYVLYTNLFWYVVFVPLVALVCTIVTEWVRESEDDDCDQRSNR